MRCTFSFLQKLTSSCCGRYLFSPVNVTFPNTFSGRHIRMEFHLIDRRSYSGSRQYAFRLEYIEI